MDHHEEVKSAEDAVREAETNLAEVRRKAAHQEYPKYVEVHASHVDQTNGHISVPMFPEFHIDRSTNAVMVMVRDAEEEAKALAVKVAEAVHGENE